MAKITWLGDVDDREGATPPDAFCTWGDFVFPVGVPVEVDDPHLLGKAKHNRFFRLEEDAAPELQSAFGPAKPEMWTETAPEDYPPKRKRGRPPKVSKRPFTAVLQDKDNVDQ